MRDVLCRGRRRCGAWWYPWRLIAQAAKTADLLVTVVEDVVVVKPHGGVVRMCTVGGSCRGRGEVYVLRLELECGQRSAGTSVSR